MLIRRCIYYYYLQQLKIEMQCTELGKGKGYLFVERRYTKVGYVFCQKWQGVGAWTSGRSLAVQNFVECPLAAKSEEKRMFSQAKCPPGNIQ